jgi:hypothetical protein
MPGEQDCKRCVKENLPCAWVFEPGEVEDVDLEKRRRTLSSDGGEDRTPEKRPRNIEDLSVAPTFRYICPFFYRDPERWRKIHSCSGDGWEQFHRLKYVSTPLKRFNGS